MPVNTELKYYQKHRFNPVPIDVESKVGWLSHVSKRRNLYEKHLGIPASSFRNASVVEFGCNSGENALYLASLGASLTLVEPNDQILPKLKSLFKKFCFEKNIESIVNTDVAGFSSKTKYDIALAEGFLNSLSNRDELFLKICSLITPSGIGVVSFGERYGSLLEFTRQLILVRACRLKNINDMYGEESLKLAREFFGYDFAQISASRPFHAWWKDSLVNPFISWKSFWTYQELIPLIEKAGCEFYSSSPKWSDMGMFRWYKNVMAPKECHRALLQSWERSLPYFLTGKPAPAGSYGATHGAAEAAGAVSRLIKNISEYRRSERYSVRSIAYPEELDRYLCELRVEGLTTFNAEMKKIFAALDESSAENLIAAYHSAKYVRTLWGVPYHYISFIRGNR